MDMKLIDILACPICKGQLIFNKQNNELICCMDRLAYPIQDGIPMMLEESARELSGEEVEKY